MSNPLLARYAECIFWLARFVERAENLARILDVNETFSRDRQGGHDWFSIVQLNGDEDVFAEKHRIASAANVLRFYVIDAGNPTAIVSAIASARENARTLRPLISTEMWVQLNVFYNRLKALGEDDLRPGRLTALFTEIKDACQCFTGITEGTFYRDQAWYFYRIGRYIERADQTTRLLDTRYRRLHRDSEAASAAETGQWLALLRSASGYHAFRRTHTDRMTPAAVVGFLLFDRSFPRSVALCIAEIEAALTQLKSRYALRAGNDVAEDIDALRATLSGLSLDQILAAGLHEFIDFIQRQLILITLRLAAAFFGHRPEPGWERQWMMPAWDAEPAAAPQPSRQG
jgi:uncharacterized alpha-E superfamily protein